MITRITAPATAPRTGRKPNFEDKNMDPNDIISIIGGGVILLVGALLAAKYFPNEIAQFWRRLGAPSTSSIKKQSNDMLAEMDRNVAERKARQGR